MLLGINVLRLFFLYLVYLVSLQQFSDISRTLEVRSSVYKQRFVPKTKLNICKRAFSVDALSILNQRNQLTLPKL